MGFLDKLLGRSKKAAGDHFDDPSLRREGVKQEHEAMAEDRSLDVEEPKAFAEEGSERRPPQGEPDPW